MTKEEEKRCLTLFKEYRRLCKDRPDGWKSVAKRNELFEIMQRDLLKWIKKELEHQSVYKTKEEILSWSWDVFEYALSKFETPGRISMLKHFSKYASYRVKLCLSNERHEDNRNTNYGMLSELDPVLREMGMVDNMTMVVGGLLDVKGFREVLTPQYKLIFNDAVDSFKCVGSLSGDGHCTNKLKCRLPAYRYDEAKKVLRQVILYFMK